MIELKPCPFCGSKVNMKYSLGKAHIGCDNSKCNIQPSTWLYANTNRVDKLVRIWNTQVKGED